MTEAHITDVGPIAIPADNTETRPFAAPAGLKNITVKTASAMELCDLYLQRHDLERAMTSLRTIFRYPDDRDVADGLIRNAVVRYAKCFGDQKSRRSARLDCKEIFGEDKNSLEMHNYVIDLRNKHIVHDENPFEQCVVFASLNHSGEPKKINRVGAQLINYGKVDEELVRNLIPLIGKSIDWVKRKMNDVGGIVEAEMESKLWEWLINQPEPVQEAPKQEDVDKRRKK